MMTLLAFSKRSSFLWESHLDKLSYSAGAQKVLDVVPIEGNQMV